MEFSVFFLFLCFHHKDIFETWAKVNILPDSNNKKTAKIIEPYAKEYYLCCIMLLFRRSFISVARCSFQPSIWIRKDFVAVYSPTEEETATNDLSLDFFYFKWGLATFAPEMKIDDWSNILLLKIGKSTTLFLYFRLLHNKYYRKLFCFDIII